MCSQNTQHSRSTIQSSTSIRSVQESLTMDVEVVSSDESVQSDSTSDSDSTSPEEGAYAFSFLKRNAEVHRLKSEGECATRRSKQQRNFLLENVQDCFSLSSLEIDLGDDDSVDNDNDNSIVTPDMAVSRFSARASSARGSMDFIPPLPVSSDRGQQEGVRRVVSQCELGSRTRWHTEMPLASTSVSSDRINYKEQEGSIRQHLRESRWSSSSERSLHQDALDVLLDKVSYSHLEDDDTEVQKQPSSTFVDAAVLIPPRRLSMDFSLEGRQRSTRKENCAPVLPRRGSVPTIMDYHDRRWEVSSRISSSQDSLRSPMRFRR
jgi:hypothetical protein